MNAAGHHPDLAARRALQSWAAARHVALYFDAACLLQDQWTGIPAVAAGLARELLSLFPVRFFAAGLELDSNLVAAALERHDGGALGYEFRSGGTRLQPVRPERGATNIGIFPTVKSARRLFDHECGIVHDLSTLITPQFHDQANILHHMENLRDDIASNSITTCVSEATRRDLIDYLGVDPARTMVAYPAATWRAEDIAAATRIRDFTQIEPYFLILGTREPRKNIGLVMAMLELDPGLLDQCRFVFTGKMGSLPLGTLSAAIKQAIDRGRISFTGYVSEADKCTLVMNATATIYPSFFEGFGLPVIESLALGTPCLASCSSSLPEVGGDACRYFDPFSAGDLLRCVREALQARDGVSQTGEFSWSRMAIAIMSGLRGVIGETDLVREKKGRTSFS